MNEDGADETGEDKGGFERGGREHTNVEDGQGECSSRLAACPIFIH